MTPEAPALMPTPPEYLKSLGAGLKTRPVRAPGLQATGVSAISGRPRALTRRFPRVFKHALSREPKDLSRSVILYYPGSGTDYGPFRLFAENSNVTTVIYADYRVTEHEARQFITHLPGWQLEGEIERLEPDFFRADWWEDFWPDDPASRENAGPPTAFALRATLSRSTKSVEFLFLATEAIQTFSILAESGLVPTMVVLQDHGFGCGWAKFGGESNLFTSASSVGLPQLLLVAANTAPWPGYGRASESTEYDEQMPTHPRALFRRVLPKPS